MPWGKTQPTTLLASLRSTGQVMCERGAAAAQDHRLLTSDFVQRRKWVWEGRRRARGNSDECQSDLSWTLKCFLFHHNHHRNVTAGCTTSSLFPGSNRAAGRAEKLRRGINCWLCSLLWISCLCHGMETTCKWGTTWVNRQNRGQETKSRLQ